MTGPLEFNNKSVFQAIKKVRTINEEDYTLSLGVGADKSAALEIAKNGVILGRIDITADGTIKNFKTTQRLIEEDEIYYKSGDNYTSKATTFSSHSYSETCAGSLTTANSEILFAIKTSKSLKNISSVTINNMNITARNPEGYIFQKTDALKSYDCAARKINDNTIAVSVYKSSCFADFKNNTPVSIELMDVVLSFT